jgi:hypothetical protein
VAARGTLVSIDPGIDGDIYAVTLEVDGRLGESGSQALALRRSIHGDVTDCVRGTHLRIVRASLRQDGRLRADISTCVFNEDMLPELKCEATAR